LNDGITTETVTERRDGIGATVRAVSRTQTLHRAVVRALRRAGWDLHRHPGWFDFAHRRAVLLRARGVDLVVDVGANAGQYGEELREYGYGGEIVSMEPLREPYARLAARAGGDPRWTALRTAAGSQPGELTINVAANSDSSSALAMLDRHLDAAPQSAYVGHEQAPVDRLDAIADPYVARARRPYLKIDTQGFEWDVLDGAAELLPRLAGVELELSLVALYEGQRTWLELVERMAAVGLRPVGLGHDFWDERTGETLQVDGIFVRG
jgi:FkbM family methyltransferase